MKRIGYIYNKVWSLDNIKKAILKASLGKRQQNRVQKILLNLNYYAIEIQHLLKNRKYVPSPYEIKEIHDGATHKTRTICKPAFYPDQIIHWALMLQLEPYIMRSMYAYNCGSVPNRGTALGQKMLRKWLDKDSKNTKYCLQMDVSKFYPSVDNEILKQMFRRKIKDNDCLWLIDTIINSAQGLPIGNYTSQWFANFFLEGLDHYIKGTLGIKYYVRYVDDLVLLGANKKKLHKTRKAIAEYLSGINLKLKNNWQVFKVNSRAIDFLGFRFYRDCTTLRKRNALRIRRRCLKINKKDRLSYRDACAIISYWGWIKRSDSYRFYSEYVKPLVSINKARKVVSWHGRNQAIRLRPNSGV
jgi:RNA-directed DNA polymerase